MKRGFQLLAFLCLLGVPIGAYAQGDPGNPYLGSVTALSAPPAGVMADPYLGTVAVVNAPPNGLLSARPSSNCVSGQQYYATDNTTLYISSTSPTCTWGSLGGASDATLTTTDITTNNVSTSKHGFAPKSDNVATHYLDGTGAYSTPAGGAVSPDTVPASPNALDDEFNGSALDAKWTWTNQGSCTFAEGGGAAGITCPTNGGSNNLRHIYQATPSTPWEFEAKVSWLGVDYAASTLVGLIATESATGKSVTCMAGGDGSAAFNIWGISYSNLTTFSAATKFSANSRFMNYVNYFKIKDDGTNVTCSFSVDGINFATAYATFAVVSTFTTAPNRVGIVVNSNALALIGGFDWFRRTL